MNIGTIIKDLREEKGLSPQQLAKKIGVTRKAVDFWEKNINEPKASYIYNLATFFNVTSDYILGLEDEFGNKIKQNDAQPPKTITKIETDEKPKLVEVPIAARSRGNKIPPKTYFITEEQLDELFNRLMKKKE